MPVEAPVKCLVEIMNNPSEKFGQNIRPTLSDYREDNILWVLAAVFLASENSGSVCGHRVLNEKNKLYLVSYI